ncbi:RsiV family protein [Clostridium luticellarii]|uniref:DUF3298 domain-containing protein n=2 Tax=Clostridium luticellarii TaxID=1691940 RepID=A0A2T0BB06_9CLOT|nr:RsiV family protein [Clostridium luticellarii]MCI1945463.1 RsiV family protein [Clostridium luticellarii]MCI1968796.1 RsiV family protein [Clostridium luticellarii]MCI1995867.1 RsiV family protein [Clostridium luticellarii]MCI2040293.1 RsiV family protein [Clostridium luticellarii]PRR81025.1 hypothetical protein CLLU_32440 [Clostridium luticellarii]
MLYFNYPDNSEYTFSIDSSRSSFYRNDTKTDSVKLNEQKLSPTNFSINYPVISNEKETESITKINNAIADEVGKLFRSQVLLPEVVDFHDVLGNYETMLNEKNILSILFSMGTYINHAAHGYTKYSSITANTETGQIYDFSDLFNPKVYYTKVLNELAMQYIKENNIDLISEYKGITEDQQYYLTPENLVLYYQIYEYTPYVYGLFKIEIPYNEITGIISPASPIARLIGTSDSRFR